MDRIKMLCLFLFVGTIFPALGQPETFTLKGDAFAVCNAVTPDDTSTDVPPSGKCVAIPAQGIMACTYVPPSSDFKETDIACTYKGVIRDASISVEARVTHDPDPCTEDAEDPCEIPGEINVPDESSDTR